METEKVQEHYDVNVPRQSGSEYEYDRWFKNAELRAGYDMTRAGIVHMLRKVENPKRCFELGPGAGTWTALLCETYPGIHIDALDISEHMLTMVKEKTKEWCSNISFIHQDFLSYTPNETYDLFFSSRVFEYIPDQDKAVGTIAALLKTGGKGILITKYPRYFGYKLRGQKVPDLHKGQIHPEAFKALCHAHGLRVTSIRPAVLTMPLFRSAFLHRMVYALLGAFPQSAVHAPFTESYITFFEKV